MNMTSKNYPTAGAYVRLWRRLQAAPRDQELTPGLSWDIGIPGGCNVAAALQKFSGAVNNRINTRGGDRPRGRDDTIDHYWQEWRDKHAIEGRARFYQLETKECRARFSHLLSRYED